MKRVKFGHVTRGWIAAGIVFAIFYYLGMEYIQLKHTGVFIIVLLVLSFALPLVMARIYSNRSDQKAP